MTITWVDEKYLKNLIEENSSLLKENHDHERHIKGLREHIKGLEKTLYHHCASYSPDIIDLPSSDRETLNLKFSICQYKSPNGNHIIVKEYNDQQICYKYYIGNCSIESKDYIEIIKHFFNSLLQIYGD